MTPETTGGAATLAARLPALSVRARAAMSAFCGAGLTLAQAPVGLWPVLFLAWPVLAALIARAPGPRVAAACGFWAGLGFFSTGLYWVGEAFLVEAARHWWYAPLMPAAVLALAAVCAAFWAGGFALARGFRRDGWRGAVALALAMTAAELARGAALTGFPWALQAYAWIDAPVFQTASFLGADALSGLTVFVASLPAFAARRAPWPAVGALICVAVAWGYGAARLEGAPAPAPDAPVIRLVQPNTAQVDKWAPENRGPIFERLLRLTAEPAERAPTLVVWPEVAVTFLFDESPQAQARAARAAGDAALALGAIRRDGAGAFRNSLLLYGPAGEALAVYDKIRLTPFGEYLPYKWVLSRIGLGVLGEGFSNLSPGDAPGLLRVGGLPPAAPSICYEIIFPRSTREAARGAGFIIQVTNDAWFGESAGPWQHLALARARAVELGLPVARAASTGVSAMIDGYGRILAAAPLNSEAALDSPLPPRGPETLVLRVGHWPALLLLASLGGVILCFGEKRRSEGCRIA